MYSYWNINFVLGKNLYSGYFESSILKILFYALFFGDLKYIPKVPGKQPW